MKPVKPRVPLFPRPTKRVRDAAQPDGGSAGSWFRQIDTIFGCWRRAAHASGVAHGSSP